MPINLAKFDVVDICIPLQGGPQADRDSPSDREGRRMDVSDNIGRDGKDRTARGGYLNIPPPEHGCTVYCKQYHYGPVHGGVGKARAKDIQVMVGTGKNGYGRDVDSISGGGNT